VLRVIGSLKPNHKSYISSWQIENHTWLHLKNLQNI